MDYYNYYSDYYYYCGRGLVGWSTCVYMLAVLSLASTRPAHVAIVLLLMQHACGTVLSLAKSLFSDQSLYESTPQHCSCHRHKSI